MEPQKFEMSFAERKLEIEVGRLAQQANGSAVVRYGDTTVLATAVMRATPGNADYLPLTVEYEERLYAAGKIKGSKWVKREGRPSEEAILAGRLVDRTLRPRFDQRIRNDIQIVTTVLSIDKENDPEMPALLAGSLALMISDIPWGGPLAGARIAKKGEEIIVCPSYEQRQNASYDIFVSGDGQTINMIEAEATEVAEKDFVQAVEKIQEPIKQLINFQNEIIQTLNPQKTVLTLSEPSSDLRNSLKKYTSPRLQDVLFLADRQERNRSVEQVRQEWLNFVAEKYPEEQKLAANLFDQEIDIIIHQNILAEGKRSDGRKLDELRQINCQVSFIPRTHGSGLFQRGETQALSIATLAAPGAEQWIEEMEFEGRKRFMHHYNFPPYSVGETGPMRGPGRREIGHGALAEKAIRAVLPTKEQFPYTVRIVSEILSSNGSSSMASACGSTLALMDAGVPITRPVAGIAMGLMMENEKNYKILTDIQGPEDHHGDMDFKIAGTQNGITAAQMDVKVRGVTVKIINETLQQSKQARLQILQEISKIIDRPREQLSEFAPRIEIIKINPSKIRDLIGAGGKTINKLIEDYGVTIDIEDDGSVYVASENVHGIQEALTKIKSITYEPVVGESFVGTVNRLLNFGALVEILPGQNGLLHVSELTNQPNMSIHQLLKEGQEIKVKIKEIDDLGRLNLILDQAKIAPSNDYSHENRYAGDDHRQSDTRFNQPKRYNGFNRSR
ncbi:MAG: polyribonucleotide nucleotidyltransferase [Candidatus Portnoybacteria bacterium CG10_big_fil_rev_8_21_14_0_10_40_22]|uniref:Polyribonucleotide nucleotidyltransferase n=2 Tax=Candidatus Portnoyibacteriota TaxID=1817913 RepID=A0A2M8KH51_9BACT|nr:MAG: polyribonucleotide nucleotidyltransferase [Candidatus Portnoybacteria bacterium CG_4_10_14_0_2_um_filter_39_11]PJE59240.1 MAG: polyribonucleotide nucleotidyltransferase [Candidatus Portnoybacteria bacterium CG10_big_fil_rev_8_21_14_0_10_40_22]